MQILDRQSIFIVVLCRLVYMRTSVYVCVCVFGGVLNAIIGSLEAKTTEDYRLYYNIHNSNNRDF